MPQMMPINWILSLFFFIMIFILFNILNYYIFNYTQSNSIKMSMKKNFFLWKW